MRKIFILEIIFFLFFLSVKTVNAADKNFSINASSAYKINENGVTTIYQNVKIKNLSEFFYSPSYTLDLSIPDIKNVIAYNSDGKIPVNVNKTSDGTSIEVDFKKRIVGLNKINDFTVSFETSQIAKKHGNVWEINIPGISNPDDFLEYNISVDTPANFGKPVIVKPEKSLNSNFFTKDEIGRSGVYLIFGNSQIYMLNLSYHLSNKNLFPVKTEIAIPPSTNYQDIFINDIYPKPSNVYKDKDGNWLATYSLSPSQKLDITVKAYAKIYPSPKEENLSDADRENYLKQQSYWETDNPEIRRLANSLKTPSNIYNYVVSKLSYNYNKVVNGNERQGAKKALANPDFAVCLEFTDLFVALSRALGIPARSIEGYAYTENSKLRPLSLVKDILHSWPEYYDDSKKTWIMVDPTWGNTTHGIDYFNSLDLNHIVFVKKGIDSTYPVPAGGYKYNQDSKDIDISFSRADNIIPADLIKTEIMFQDFYLSGFPINGDIIIRNNGNALSKPFSLQVNSDFAPSTQIFNVDSIPPFASKVINVNFYKTPFFTNKIFSIDVNDSQNKYVKNVRVGFLPKRNILLIGGGFLATILAALLFTTKPWRLFIQK